MEIEQHLHAGSLRPGDRLLHVGKIAVTSPGRVVPDSDTNDVGAFGCEQLERVNFLPILAEDCAAILNLVHVGEVSAEIELRHLGVHGSERSR
jgi:hypothetical protein